jgi:hypothetical protein
MRRMWNRFPLRLFLSLLLIWSALMIAELYFFYDGRLADWDCQSIYAAVAAMSRSHNQLLSVVLVSVAVAIPITATHYTPKLLRLFLTDRIHLSILTIYALAALHANWVTYLVREGEAAQYLVGTVMFTAFLGFSLVVPYFCYVIWFLEPTSLVSRIRKQGVRAVRFAARNHKLHQSKRDLAHSLHNLGSLMLKAIDGSARRGTEEAIRATREILQDYGSSKAELSAEWFHPEDEDFRGLAPEAMSFIAADHCWAEIVALQDLNLAFEAAMTKMPDAVVYVADTIRGIASDAYKRNDIPVVDNAIRAFNSNIRFAITHGEPHAVFDVLTQYRVLAEEALGEHPGLAVEIAENLAYYSGAAQSAGLKFVPELFMYDMGLLYRAALEKQSDAVDPILEVFVIQTRKLVSETNVPMACAFLVTYAYAIRDLDSAQDECFLNLAELFPVEMLQAAFDVINRTNSPRYRELTARQVDLNFVPPPFMEDVQKSLTENKGVSLV